MALSREEMVQNGGLGIVRIAGLVWRGRPGVLREVEQGLPNVVPQMLERLAAAGREVEGVADELSAPLGSSTGSRPGIHREL